MCLFLESKIICDVLDTRPTEIEIEQKSEWEREGEGKRDRESQI